MQIGNKVKGKPVTDRLRVCAVVIGHAHVLKTEALAKLGKMIKRAPKAKGTRGQLRGTKVSGGSKVDPPEKTAP